MMPGSAYDIVVVGSGPAGQKAAIQGAKAGKKVVLIEQEQGIGGNCVYRGTIPSKTLQETALQFERLKRSNEVFEGRLRLDLPMTVLLHRLDEVVKAHECYMADQLARNGVTYWHGRARLCRRMKCNWKPSTALPRPFSPRPSFWRRDRVPAPFLKPRSIMSMCWTATPFCR
ncbi:MAG: FAD-dependent oxidoreductase [Nitrospira sp.]|nr:FAD-dependent oxidoreductase [Nitrospira sp.]